MYYLVSSRAFAEPFIFIILANKVQAKMSSSDTDRRLPSPNSQVLVRAAGTLRSDASPLKGTPEHQVLSSKSKPQLKPCN